MNAENSITREVPWEVPTMEYARIEPALDRALLDSVTEYLDGIEPIDGDPTTLFDCSRDYQEAA